jgi:hypothetical protein
MRPWEGEVEADRPCPITNPESIASLAELHFRKSLIGGPQS